MTGNRPDASTRRPAVVVGGARRRLVRRPGLPRPRNAPSVNPESATATPESSVAAGYGTHPADNATDTSSQNASDANMDFYSPHGGIPIDFCPTKSRPTATANKSKSAHSPAASISGDTAEPAKGKKKHGLFNLKLKDSNRPSSSHSPAVTSPIPISTPQKAARFLGLESDAASVGSPRRGHAQHDGNHDDVFQVENTKEPRSAEEDADLDPPKGKKFWETSNLKARRVLEFLPSRKPGIKHASDYQDAAPKPRLYYPEDDGTKEFYSSGSGNYSLLDIPPSAQRPAQRRRTRKKGPKSLDRMTPITEASHDELSTAYRNSGHETELAVISEYEQEYIFPPRGASLLPRLQTDSLVSSTNNFELNEDDLSPMDDMAEEEEYGDEQQAESSHLGKQIDLSQVRWSHPAVMSSRGPLQTIENCLLDMTEEDLEKHRAMLDKLDAERFAADARVAAMKVSHEKMKKEFEAFKQRTMHHSAVPDVNPPEDSASDDEADLVSLRSSIDLDEEPTVHVAKAVTFTRVVPGMVKLVDIPPRKNKAQVSVPLPAAGTFAPSPTLHKQMGKLKLSGERVGNVEPPFRANPQHESNSKKNKKALLRNESRQFVQNWVTGCDPQLQRPLSERVDADVLADQQIPPAPFPKEDQPTPSPRKHSKHFCLSNGHIFHPVNLKQVPDDVGINSLKVRPYLETHTGTRQHVHVPVLCDRCAEDVKEEIWECEIAVCHMSVCKECAQDMEEEWRKRAAISWTR
ncbi:hypothetical protein ACN47E_005359 [Coniothyrium glycines]